MKPWLRARYYCTNVANGCAAAKTDRPFSAEEHAHCHGLCPGADERPCGALLKAGAPLDLRPRWTALAVSALFLCMTVFWSLRAALFPPPLAHIDFVARQSESTDDAGVLGVEIVRTAALDKEVLIRYAVIDGSAKAGADFTIAPGQLRFAPGQRSKTLTIVLVPDASFVKPRRAFTVVLSNVLGEPRHVVTIGQRSVARSDALAAERSVLAASVIAKDIADLAVRQRVLGRLLTNSRDRNAEFVEYRRSLAAIDGNLVRARESYLQLLRELRSQQPATVLAAMDRVASELQGKSFDQQAQAVRVMKRQFTELLGSARPDTDRWVEELSRIVPLETETKPQEQTAT